MRAFGPAQGAYDGCVSYEIGQTARIEDAHELATGMPYVTADSGTSDNSVYQVGEVVHLHP